MSPMELSDREIRVLEAVIQVYIQTAEPRAARRFAQRFPIGVLLRHIRNTMSDLEERDSCITPTPPPGGSQPIGPIAGTSTT